MSDKELISGFMTKFALTGGICEFQGEIVGSDMVRVVTVKGQRVAYPYFLHKEGSEWHRTREAAVERAEVMRAKKIESLRKQIAKLEKVTFGAFALALLLAATPALAAEKGDTITGVVERVYDGDGPVINGAMLRLWGIDTPEMAQEPRALAKVAKATLESLVLGKTVSCKVKGFSYRRPVVHCAVGDLDVGAEMVRSGYAWLSWRYAGDFYDDQEEEAVCARRGIWAVSVEPAWHWRACRR